ncbi:hypothetical protein MMPV_009137 [Pyropia vietnamensis]
MSSSLPRKRKANEEQVVPDYDAAAAASRSPLLVLSERRAAAAAVRPPLATGGAPIASAGGGGVDRLPPPGGAWPWAALRSGGPAGVGGVAAGRATAAADGFVGVDGMVPSRAGAGGDAVDGAFPGSSGDSFAMSDFESVYARMRAADTGVAVADRRWRVMTYTKCFVGSEAVTWMMENLGIGTRPEAVKVGQGLMDAGLVHHVTHSEPFADEYFFYRWQEDDESSVLNMKRVWGVDRRPRHAVDVSVDLLTAIALICEENRKGALAVATAAAGGVAPGSASPHTPAGQVRHEAVRPGTSMGGGLSAAAAAMAALTGLPHPSSILSSPSAAPAPPPVQPAAGSGAPAPVVPTETAPQQVPSSQLPAVLQPSPTALGSTPGPGGSEGPVPGGLARDVDPSPPLTRMTSFTHLSGALDGAHHAAAGSSVALGSGAIFPSVLPVGPSPRAFPAGSGSAGGSRDATPLIGGGDGGGGGTGASVTGSAGLLGSRALAAVGVSPVFNLSAGSPSMAADAANGGESDRRGGSIVLEGSDNVDYDRLRASASFRAFAVATAELQRVDLLPLNHDERLAFFANVYNTLVLHAHAVYGPPATLLRRWVFFRTLSYRVGGTDWTLDDIEHGVLRGNARPPMLKFLQQLRVGDPRTAYVLGRRDGRIHFVISAGTVSDPPVRILEGEDVEALLDEATSDFLDVAVSVDVEARVVRVPRIFCWYAVDFPRGTGPLLRWIARYVRDELRVALLSLVDGAPPASPALGGAGGAAAATSADAAASASDGLLRRSSSSSMGLGIGGIGGGGGRGGAVTGSGGMGAGGGGESPCASAMAAAVSPGGGSVGGGDAPSVTIKYENFDWTADARFSAAVVRRKRRRLARAAAVAAAAAAAGNAAPTGHLSSLHPSTTSALPAGALPDGAVVTVPPVTFAQGVFSSATPGPAGSGAGAGAGGGSGGGGGGVGGGGGARPSPLPPADGVPVGGGRRGGHAATPVAVPDMAAVVVPDVPDVGAATSPAAAGRRADRRGGPSRSELGGPPVR